MEHRVRLLVVFAQVLAVPLLMVLGENTRASDEQRGLKSSIPEKPQFEEPRFKDEEPGPLQNRKVLPDPSDRPGADSIKTAPSFFVSKIELMGGSIFAPSVLQPILASYENRQVSMEELQALRQQLSMMYFQRGYVNSGVIIPDQPITDGVVQFRVIEGKVSNVRLTGQEGLRDRYILERINTGLDDPLNVNQLQGALRRLKNDRLIRKINAELRPLDEPGVAELDVNVTEAESRQASVVIDNFRSPSIGAEAVTVAYDDFNLSGQGDALGVDLSVSEGSRSAGLDYEYPLSVYGSKLSGYFNYRDSEVVEEPFDQLDIESDSMDFGLAYSVPVYDSNRTSANLRFGLNHKDSSSFLLGEPFSFSTGAVEGESKSSNLSLGGDVLYRKPAQVYALSLAWRQGVDALGSNIANKNTTPDSEYSAIVGQAQFASRLPVSPGARFIAQTAFQVAFDPLLSIDKFAIGGHSTVRGYRENQLVRDNGVTASLELRLPVFVDENGNDTANFQLIPFLDWGQAWDENAATQNDEKLEIASAGLGFAWQPIAGAQVNLFWGEALEDEVKSDDGDDLQDNGLHFSIGYRVMFQ